jgi:hypothetical protein
MHTRSELMSRESSGCCSKRRATFSSANGGAAVMVDPWVSIVRNQESGSRKKSNGSRRTIVPPPAHLRPPAQAPVRNMPMRPMSCESGSHEHAPSPRDTSSRSRIARTLAAIMSRVSVTPVGRRVEPELNCTKAAADVS